MGTSSARRSRRTGLPVIIVVVASLVILSAAMALFIASVASPQALDPAAAATAASPASGQHFAGLFQVGDLTQAAKRYRVVILNEWNAERISALKQSDPNVKVLLYKNSFFLRSDDNASTVGGFRSGENIDANHPDWFLKDADGNRIVFQYYAGIDFYVMDWGNQQWREYWTRKAITSARDLGFDGIFADDLYTRKWGVIDRPLQKYADSGALQSAVRGFLAYAYSQVKATDGSMLLVGNVVDHLWYPNLWADWLSVSDGLMDEQFVHVGESASTGYKSLEDWWRLQVDEVVTAESMGKACIFVSHGASDDYQTMLFAYGTYMLGVAGRANYYHELGGSLDTPAWFPLWERDLGAPSGPYVARADGLFTREFANGMVAVNPSKSASRTLNASGYVNESGVAMGSLDLAPHRAVVLFKAVAQTTTTVAPTTTTVAPTTTTVAPTTTTTAVTQTTTTIAQVTTTSLAVTTTTAPATTLTTVVPPSSLPSVHFIKPLEEQLARKRIAVEVGASAPSGILKVTLRVDAKLVATDRTPPYAFTWDARRATIGEHSMLATVYDRVGNAVATARTIRTVGTATSSSPTALSAGTYQASSGSATSLSTGVIYPR